MASRPVKRLFLDLETTGLDPVKCGVVQIAAIIEIDGKVMHTFDFRAAPFPDDIVTPEALKVTGKTLEEVQAYKAPLVVYKNLIDTFAKFVDRYDKNDKFTMVGYNSTFDDNFLRAWFEKMHTAHPELGAAHYYGSWIAGHRLDVYQLAIFCKHFGVFGFDQLANIKQETIAKALGIVYGAHDGLQDIRACHKIFYLLTEKLGMKQDVAA